jgi:acetylornithine deacetylase
MRGAFSTEPPPELRARPGRLELVKPPVMPQASQVPDDRLDATLAMLERLIGFDTESAKSNLGLVAFVEGYLKSLGVAYVKIPNAVGDKAALFASVGPNRDGGIVLSGHTDVVPVEGQTWTSDPFKLRREVDRVYGRGACDMKGFDAI